MRVTSALESATHGLAPNSPSPRYQTSWISSPPRSLAAENISPWMRQARSQVGSRLAVASIAKISRPTPPLRTTGMALTLARKSATSPRVDLVGSLLSVPGMATRRIWPRGLLRSSVGRAAVHAHRRQQGPHFLACRDVRHAQVPLHAGLAQIQQGQAAEEQLA